MLEKKANVGEERDRLAEEVEVAAGEEEEQRHDPINVREIGCNHVFCCYCIMIQLLPDKRNGISCPESKFTKKCYPCLRSSHERIFEQEMQANEYVHNFCIN